MTRIRATVGRQNRSWRAALCFVVLCSLAAPAASASDQIFFPAVDNTIDKIVQRINAETVRLDISTWYLTEHAISIAIANKFNAGVQVRLIGDRGSIFEIDPNTKAEFYWLANQGVPIRLRFNPTWYPEINHWKMAIFVGQNVVEFGSANWVTFELAPASANNYDDETVMFTDDPTLVNAFKTKFDRMWNDTTAEPQSVAGGPPYLKDWADACANEPLGCDFRTVYPNPRPMTINRARLEPDNPMPADLIWGQGPEFNNRLVQEINNEPSFLQFVIYRLTVANITNALLARWQAGVQMQLIVEPQEYLNKKWPEFWLTHAYIDKLWAAGVPIKQRAHQGLTHMKTLVTGAYASNASSNYAAAWQRDHDYFVSSATKPAIYTAIKNRVTAMWNDSVGFTTFQPQPPDASSLSSPSASATNVAVNTSLVWNIAAFATDYDVYLGLSTNLTRMGNVQAQLVNDPPSTYSWTPPTALCAGTTYFWQIVSRTNATPVRPSMVASSSVRSFTTAGANTGCSGLPGSGGGGGGGGGTVPSPWTTQDIGAVGTAGSANFANGTFTVRGAGADIWDAADAFRFVSQPVGGDTEIVARVTGIQNTNGFAKAGVMIRSALTAGSAHVILDVRPGGSVEFMRRATNGGQTTYLGGATIAFPGWLKLARSGSTVTAYTSGNGSTWTPVGSTTLTTGAANAGLVVSSHDTGVLNTSTFDSVTVSSGSTPPPPPPPPPPPTATDVVIYASDVPAAARHGSWSPASDPTSPNGVKLVTTDAGVANPDNPLAAPTDYFDVTFNADAGVPYRIWLRLQALGNSKFNDAVWVQFSDARVNGAAVYPINTTSGLLVNLATTSEATSLNKWGWSNSAYWLSQATTVTFANSGSHTLRIQIREDGVQLDQIVLSAGPYLNAPPGPPTNDATIVQKP